MPLNVRFGAFELDPQSGEVCSGDGIGDRPKSRVVLPQQPLRLLLMLIEREGAMVTREEIQKKFWPNDTIVEFDHSINVAIGKLRKALGDSADNPQYIATIARRGYRLMVPVTRIAVAQEEPANAAPVVGSPGVPGQLSHAAVLTGQIVSHYRVLDIIGGGGMGVVYRAEDLKLGRRVAIKFLPDETASHAPTLQRFEREAQTASSLNHPNVCTIYEFGEHKGQPFLVMELLQGKTLRDRLAVTDGTGLPPGELLEIALQISKGLQAAHHQGIIHRDIKPANIFLADHDVCKILDFGLAKMLERSQPETATFAAREPHPDSPVGVTVSLAGQVMGTAGYMSPEQALGKELDARTDLFSFGAVLYEMATGQMPFRTEKTSDVFDAILNRVPVSPARLNPDLPPALGRIIERALEKNRERRYQSAAEMRTELQRLKRDTESGRPAGLDVSSGPAESGSAASRARVPAPHKSTPDDSAHAGTGTLARPGQPYLGKKLGWYSAAALILVALIAGGYYYRSHRGKTLSEKDTIVLGDFANSTGDAIFDDTLKTALTVSLNQSPFLNVLSNDKVAATLKLMTKPPDTKLTPDIARDLCQRAGSKAYIDDAIGSLGSKYVLELKAVNCQGGGTLADEQLTVESKERVLDALGGAATKLRAELGESLATVQRFDVPLAQATTSSLEALKAYTSGDQVRAQKGFAAALPLYLRAIELDPNFAMGYSRVGGDYFNLGEVARGNEYFTRAFQLRDHASELERLRLEADYYSNVTGELDKAAQTQQEKMANYPRENEPYVDLASIYDQKGQFEKAAELLASKQGQGQAFQNASNDALALQHFDEARQLTQQALKPGSNDFILRNAAYGLAFVQGDSAGMAEQLQWYSSKPAYENIGLALASDTEAYVGHLAKTREITKRAVDSAIHVDSRENGAIWQENAALREAAFGNPAPARQLAADALKIAPTSSGAEAEAALAFAMAGDMERAQSLAHDLNQRFPLNNQMQSLWLAPIQGQLALDRKNPAAALASLQAATPIELGQVQFLINISCLYPTYIRGEAYLAGGQGKEAAAEFQKIIDHSGIVWNCWTGALAHLGVARANALQSKTLQGQKQEADADAARVRALAAYKEFLTLWKDADPDIPILKQAKAEYTKLQ